jgi:PHS family inorganic phosphate transporter-like MFS transporter
MQKTEALKKLFVLWYCMANFFQNFGTSLPCHLFSSRLLKLLLPGPNSTTFVIPGEAFPTRYRSTAHGISAASGKLGAIIAQVGFARLKDHGGAPQSGAFIKHM